MERYQTIWLILFGDEDSESSAQLFEQITRSKLSELSNSRISISIVLIAIIGIIEIIAIIAIIRVVQLSGISIVLITTNIVSKKILSKLTFDTILMPNDPCLKWLLNFIQGCF